MFKVGVKVKIFPKYVEVEGFYRVVLRSHEPYSEYKKHILFACGLV